VSYSRTCKGSQVGYRTNPGGDIITSILAGEGPWFQNACTTPLGANANAPADTSTALPRSHHAPKICPCQAGHSHSSDAYRGQR
jgi:hypothetical protein